MRTVCTCALLGVLVAPSWSYAQDPARGAQPNPAPGRGQRGQPRGLPPVGPNMNQLQLQAWIDAYALVQAERELQLTSEQYPDFVARLARLQNVRRRLLGERRRLLGELGGLVQEPAGARDAAIDEKLRALDDVARRAAGELRKSLEGVDSVLTPWQRGRFRLFEEQLERRKIELLTKVGGGQPAR